MAVSNEIIPGTAVEDNAIHRASLWLMDFQRTRGGIYRIIGAEKQIRDFDLVLRECKVDGCDGEDLLRAGVFYGQSFARAPVKPADLRQFCMSVWLDGFQHGIATRAGLRGLGEDEPGYDGPRTP